jgi:hypothetical protein
VSRIDQGYPGILDASFFLLQQYFLPKLVDFGRLPNTGMDGVRSAQLRLYVMACCASAMTWSIADLTWPVQFLGKGMVGGVVLRDMAASQRNS